MTDMRATEFFLEHVAWLDEFRGVELGANDDLVHAVERLENAIGGR